MADAPHRHRNLPGIHLSHECESYLFVSFRQSAVCGPAHLAHSPAHHTQSIRRPEPPQRPLVARHEAAPAGEDLGKLNIWCEDTQLQDPSTVNTCVMLNRMDKWGGGQRHGAALSMCRGVHAGVGVCACGRVCVVSEASPDVNISLQKYHTHTYAHTRTLTETHACQVFISEI